MSITTKALIKPNTTATEIVDYLTEKYDSAESFVSHIGFIQFKVGNEAKNLFYIKEPSDEDRVDGLLIEKSTYLSLTHSENSVEILKDICSHFGGAIDENDSDDKGFYWVNKEKFFEDDNLTFEKELELTFGTKNKNKILEIINKYK